MILFDTLTYGKMAKKKKSKSVSKWDNQQQENRVSHKVAKIEYQLGDDDHDVATAMASKKAKKRLRGYERSIHLSHDSQEKKQESRLRLHISKTNREIDELRSRLSAWDEVDEQKANKKKVELEKQNQLQLETDNSQGKSKKRRKGPETWKLRGAARPAHEVYEFDTRYVDPHLKAHEEAKAKAKRVINAFHFCKGHFGNKCDDRMNDSSELFLDTCRSFLSSSMQSALLNLEAKKFKTARERLIEIIELEGTKTLTPITNARCRLMRMYIEANRPDSARRLWERLPANFASVWIRFSAALIEYVSWKILGEPESTEQSATKLLNQAIRSNVFCAYYIAFHDTFEKVMEYTYDVEDACDGTLEQAIEYCNSEQMGSWVGTEGAIDWIRSILAEGESRSSKSNDDVLTKQDLDWENFNENNSKDGMEDTTSVSSSDSQMFLGMFRVGMEMLRAS